MNSPFAETESETPNPFLCNAPNTICIVCNKNLENTQPVSVQEILPHYKPAISLFEGLRLLSNFGEFNINNIPQRACNTCFFNTDGFLRFQKACHQAVGNIKAYIFSQERIQQHIPGASSSLTDNSNSLIEYSEVECLVSKSITLTDNSKSLIEYSDDDSPPAQCQTVSSRKDSDLRDLNVWRAELKKKMDRSKHYIDIRRKERVECTVCHKLIAKSYIKTHMNTHTGNTPYQCEICKKKFGASAALFSHTKNNHSEANHLCTICGKKFKLGSQLTVHMRGHNDERPYPCETCGRAFRTSDQRKCHYVTHTGERNFQCEICAKRYGTRNMLRQHYVTHAKVPPIECAFCGKRFAKKQSLKSHQAKNCNAINADVNK